MADCKICVKFDDCPWRSDPDAMCSAFKQKPMTNADRIRAMTDEELAEWIEEISPHTEWKYYLQGRTWLDWMKEVSE